MLPIVHHRQEFHDHHQQQQRRQWRAAAAASACPSHSSRRGRARICSAVTCAAAGAALAIAPAATAAATASFSQVFAVALGYCVLVGSLFRGVPQIVKVVQARSVEGLSVTSNVVETLCYTVVVAYNISQVCTVCVLKGTEREGEEELRGASCCLAAAARARTGMHGIKAAAAASSCSSTSALLPAVTAPAGLPFARVGGGGGAAASPLWRIA